MGKKESARSVRNDGGVRGSSRARGGCWSSTRARGPVLVVDPCSWLCRLGWEWIENPGAEKSKSLVPVRWNKRFCNLDFWCVLRHD
jgi:hypothetical protein